MRGNPESCAGGAAGSSGFYIVQNTIGRKLNCWALTPGASGGFVPGSVNVVGRKATGQCAALAPFAVPVGENEAAAQPNPMTRNVGPPTRRRARPSGWVH